MKVLIVDADPQSDVSAGFGYRDCDDISPFIKYGCLKDTKFCDKMNDYILFKNLDDKYLTLPELLVKEEEKKEDADAASDVVDKDGNSVTEDADAKDDSEEEKDERKVRSIADEKMILHSQTGADRCLSGIF